MHSSSRTVRCAAVWAAFTTRLVTPSIAFGTIAKLCSTSSAAQALSLVSPIDGESAHPHGRYRRMTRQSVAQGWRKLVKELAGRHEGVIAHYFVREGHKTSRDSTPDVIANLFAQVAVQWLRSAIEPVTVVRGVETRHPKRVHPRRKSLLRRSKARSSAGVGAGGASRARAKLA